MPDNSRRLTVIVLFLAGFICPAALKAAQTEAQAPAARIEQIEYKEDEGTVDPFATEEQPIEPAKPAAVEKKPLPQFTIQGLIWGGNIPQAIINNKVVRVGDVISNARITDIDKEGIWFSYEGQSYNLTAPGLYHSRAAVTAFKPQGGTDEEQD